MYQIPHFCAVIFFPHFVIARKRSYGKVMFLRLSVILFIGCGLCPWGVFVRGVSVRGISVREISVRGVSVREGLYQGGVSIKEGSLSRGSLSRGVSV